MVHPLVDIAGSLAPINGTTRTQGLMMSAASHAKAAAAPGCVAGPHVCHGLGLDCAAVVPKHVALLQNVGDCVVGHVDGRVRERLHEELRVPGDLCAEAERPRARPVLQPAQRVLKRVLHNWVVCLHVRQRLLRLGAPLGLAVRQAPALHTRSNLCRAGHVLAT